MCKRGQPARVQVKGLQLRTVRPGVAYAADHDNDGRAELYRVPVTEGTVGRICKVAVAEGGILGGLLVL